MPTISIDHGPEREYMMKPKIFTMKFAKIYPLLVQKAEKKGRTKEEVDTVILWLTGYDKEGLQTDPQGGRL